MGLDGHRARQRWVGLGTVCIFLNPAAKILMQDVGICTMYRVQPSVVDWVAALWYMVIR